VDEAEFIEDSTPHQMPAAAEPAGEPLEMISQQQADSISNDNTEEQVMLSDEAMMNPPDDAAGMAEEQESAAMV